MESRQSRAALFRFPIPDSRIPALIGIPEFLQHVLVVDPAFAHGGLRDSWDTKKFEIFQKEIVPAAAAL